MATDQDVAHSVYRAVTTSKNGTEAVSKIADILSRASKVASDTLEASKEETRQAIRDGAHSDAIAYQAIELLYRAHPKHRSAGLCEVCAFIKDNL